MGHCALIILWQGTGGAEGSKELLKNGVYAVTPPCGDDLLILALADHRDKAEIIRVI